MPILNLNNAVVFLLVAMTLIPSFHRSGNRGQSQNAAATVVQIDKTARGVTYKVDSKLTSLTPTTNLLYVLNRVRDQRGASTPVVVLVNPGVPLSELWNFDGVAGKAQLTNIRYFVLIPETENMSEIKWGPVIPVSRNPN